MDLLGPFLHSRSKHSLGRATWFGGVVSLLVMVTMLNVIPLQPIQYLSAVRITGPHRLQELDLEQLSQVDDSDRTKARIVAIKPIKPTDGQSSNSLIVDVYFVGHHRIAESDLFQKFQTLASSQFPPIRDEETERELRWANWRKEVLKHSIAQIRQEISDAVELPSDRFANPSTQDGLASGMQIEPIKSPFQVASVRTNESELSELHNLESDLLGQFRSVEENLAYLTDAGLRSQLASTKLALLPNSIRALPRSGKVEPQQIVGLLIMGLASWLLVGWIYLYVARGGGSDPRLVAKWLERLSVPYAGSVNWTGRLGSNESHEDGLHELEQKTTWYFHGLEYVVLLLGLWVVVRFSLDPHWRILLLDQPLSGLARLCREI